MKTEKSESLSRKASCEKCAGGRIPKASQNQWRMSSVDFMASTEMRFKGLKYFQVFTT